MPYARIGDLDRMKLESTATCDNPCVILTMDNVIEFMDDVTLNGYKAGDVFASIPLDMAPEEETAISVLVRDNTAYNRDVLVVEPNGAMRIVDNGDCVVKLRGVMFNICSRYYNDVFKNNYKQATSKY